MATEEAGAVGVRSEAAALVVLRISFFRNCSTCSDMVHPGLEAAFPDSSSSW